MALRKAATTEVKTNATNIAAQEQEAQVKETVDQAQEAQVEQNSEVQGGQEPEAAVERQPEAEAEQAQGVEEAEPAAELEEEPEPEVVAEQRQEVAVATASAPPAIAGTAGKSGAMAAFTADMADHGFEGLNVTGMSFDRIKLHEGRFKLGTEERDLGESFDCVLMGTRPIYIVRQYDGDDSPVYFSYDPKGDLLTDGSPATEIQAEWVEQGYAKEEWDIKRYLEGMATLTNRDDDLQEHMVSLSIPPASTDRLSGACAVARQKFRQLPDQLVLNCKVGASIKKGNTTWRPWVFKMSLPA
jgi:hypothetical protein